MLLIALLLPPFCLKPRSKTPDGIHHQCNVLYEFQPGDVIAPPTNWSRNMYKAFFKSFYRDLPIGASSASSHFFFHMNRRIR